MPTYFPPLNATGLISQLPYTSGRTFKTVVTKSPYNAPPTTFSWYGSGISGLPTTARGRFIISLPSLSDASFALLKTFFTTVAEGRLNEWSFIDPGGNLVPASENFADASWSLTSLSVGAAVTDPWGGSRATALTSTASDSYMIASLLPGGGASGFVLCASIWARALSSSQTLRVGFLDGGSSLIASNTVPLPQNQWVRISCSTTLATSSSIRVIFGGGGSWNSTSIQLFGAQVSATAGPGGYRQTPGADALRPKCRFDTDDLKFTYMGPSQISVQLPVSEYN
jgi:hypothetical protein